MRTLSLLLLVTIASFPFAHSGAAREEPRCAFADESFTTMLAMSSAVTEYYVTHRAWPTNRQQLRTQLLQTARTLPPPDKPSAADIDQLFRRFSRIELQPRGRDLVLAIDYRAAGKRHRHRMLLRPGRSTDEMLQASTEVK